MKILHVSHAYWPAFSGGGPIQSIHSLNKGLVRKGEDVTVYTTDAGLKEYPGDKNMDGVRISYFRRFGYKHYDFSPGLFWALARDTRKFDIVHLTGIWNSTVPMGAFWARLYRRPFAVSPRGSLMKIPLNIKNSLLKRMYLFFIGKAILKRASFIHFTSEAEKEEYLKAGLPFGEGRVIPNSIDSENIDESGRGVKAGDFRKKFHLPEEREIILFLGRLNWKKGFDTLIPAFSEIIRKEKKVFLVIVGPDEGDYRKTVEKLIAEHEVGEAVIFTGLLSGKDKIAAFRDARVFVLPSYSENFAMAVAEAMYLGLPVVISKYVGIAPSVKEKGAGLVIEKDEKELAGAVLKILHKEMDIDSMISKAKKFVQSFSLDNVAEGMRKSYEKAVRIN